MAHRIDRGYRMRVDKGTGCGTLCAMNTNIPSAREVRERLRALRPAELVRLSDRSGVPHATLMKIRTGQTKNPGIETVLQFMPHLAEMQAPVTQAWHVPVTQA